MDFKVCHISILSLLQKQELFKNMKYYAVKHGKVPGIYTTWDECKKQVNGFSNARYKSFSTKEEALKFISDNISNTDNNLNTLHMSIYTDGSYANGKMGIGIHFPNKEFEDISQYIPVSSETEWKNTNNIAELIAIEYAISKILYIDSTINHPYVTIYTDSSYCITAIIDGLYSENKSIIDRIRERIMLLKSKGIIIELHKVKGHSTCEGNNKADQLATIATQ